MFYKLPTHQGRRNLVKIMAAVPLLGAIDLLILYGPTGEFSMSLPKAFLLLLVNVGGLASLFIALLLNAIQNLANIRNQIKQNDLDAHADMLRKLDHERAEARKAEQDADAARDYMRREREHAEARFRQSQAHAHAHAANPGISDDELKDLYRTLIKKYHPDFAQSDADKRFRTELTAKINKAYQEKDANMLRLFL
jgi:hypothetical protein